MRFTTNQFSLEKMNKPQRKGIFIALTFAAIVLFLHFPFDGYTVQHEVITRYGQGECPRLTIDELNNLNLEQMNRTFEQNRLCSSESELQLRSFQDWTSDSPLVAWFGSVLHTLITLLFAGCLGVAWILVSRDEVQEK